MRTAWMIAGAYTVIQIIFAVHRWNILTIDSDTGTFAQAILDAGHGFRDAPEGGSHFRFHFSPIIAVLYPFVALTHTGLVLQFVQVVLIALCAPAVFALFRPYVSAGLCTCLAALALLYAPIASVGFTEFHELAFFPVLAIMTLWAADRQRWGWFAAFGAGCILTREDIGIEFTFIGVAIAALLWLRRQRMPRQGLLLGEPRHPTIAALAFSALSLASAFSVIGYFYVEHRIFGAWAPSQNYDYPFASGPLGLLAALFTQPLIAIPALYSFTKIAYLMGGLFPLVLLPLRSSWTLLAVPAFVILLLSSNPYQWYMGRHYSAMWAPWLIIGSGVALARMERERGIRPARRWVYAALAGCVVVLLAFNPMHLGYYLRPMYADVASARAAIACVPRGASVSTHKEWFAQIAALNPKSTFNVADGVKYLVYAPDYNDFFRRWTMPRLARSLRAGRYVQVCRFGNVVTYKRR